MTGGSTVLEKPIEVPRRLSLLIPFAHTPRLQGSHNAQMFCRPLIVLEKLERPGELIMREYIAWVQCNCPAEGGLGIFNCPRQGSSKDDIRYQCFVPCESCGFAVLYSKHNVWRTKG